MRTFLASEGKNKQMEEAIRRLCHFVPPSEGENLSLALHECLVKHAMANLGTEPHTVSDIKDSLYLLFNLNFEDEETKGAIERLMKTGSVVSPSQDVYVLSIDEYSELEKSLKESEEFEQKTIGEWIENISRKYPDLSQDDVKVLGEDLTIYLTEIFARHGAECVALVYAGQEEAESFIAKLEDDIFASLPTRSPRLHKIRIIELPVFFKNAPTERKRYIAQLLDSTFIIHMLHIDKNCSALIRKQFKDYRLYLDTNFIYRLLGLDGPILQKATETAVRIAQDLGFVLIVSTRTVEEWQTSIKRGVKNLKGSPLVSQELAQVGADYTTEEDFTTAYWRAYAKTKISIDDFSALYQRIEELLKDHDIKIRDTLCEQVKEDSQLKEEISMLNLVTDYIKHLDVAEHDAFHRLLILKLRGKTAPETFIDTKAWFLTCDTSLPAYDRFARGRQSQIKIPFCILSNQWIQTMRPLLPRTQDFDETFVDLFTSPYLRTYGDLPSNIAQAILGRITQFEQHSPELAMRVLTDRHLTKELRQTKEEEKIFELIDNATTKVAEEFKEERDKLKKQLEDTKKEEEEAERKLAEEKSQREKEREKFKGQIKETEDALTVLKGEVEEEKEARLKLEKKMKWIPACFIWIVIGVATLFVPWGNLYSWAKLLVIGCAIVGGIGALSFPLGKSKTWKILGMIAIFCSILSFVWIFIKK